VVMYEIILAVWMWLLAYRLAALVVFPT